MMELAGKSVARVVLHRAPAKGHRVLVLVGPGNNGGDGLVAARVLQEAGAEVTAYLTRARNPEQDAVFQQAQACGVAIVTQQEDPQYETLRRLASHTHVLIDSLLGIGATIPLHGVIAHVLQNVKAALAQSAEPWLTLNRVPKPAPVHPWIIAVDGPSGLDFETGSIDPLALKAHVTVTFAARNGGTSVCPAPNTWAS